MNKYNYTYNYSIINMQNIPWVDKYRPKKLDDIVNQDEVIKLLKKTLITGQLPHLLFYGPSGVGKCLAYNTPILLYDGTIKMVQDVNINDKLMGDDNNARNILNITTGKDTMYRIKQENGDHYDVNSEHIISLKLIESHIVIWSEEEQTYTFYWLENHMLKYKYFVVEHGCFKQNISNNLNTFKLHILKQATTNQIGDICDISILDYINKCDIWKQLYKGFKCDEINCWDKKFVDIDPYQYGYQLSNNDQILLNYKINDTISRSHFLAGYIDNHGFVNDGHYIVNTNDNKKLFDDIIFISRSLGHFVVVNNLTKPTSMKASLSDFALHSADLKNNEYELHIYEGQNYIPTKSKILINKSTKPLTYNIDIEKLNFDNYYGFEIDGNKRFLLGDFTVTHNTSTILAVAYQLFGPKIFKERVLELNASDERGINVVRYKINTFARTAIGNSDPEYPSPPYKLVILDEADAMTTEAQSALRKVMEELSSITRFCFICNYKNQIIDPIISRCMKFRFKPINKISMFNKLSDVSKKENMIVNTDCLNAICSIVKGDVRKGIMILQNLRYILKYKQDITKNDIYNMTGQTSPEYVMPIWDLCFNKKSNIKDIMEQVNQIKLNGTPVTSILENLQIIIVESDIDDIMKSKISIHIASTEKCLNDGSNEYIQLLNIFSYIYSLVHGFTNEIPSNLC